LCAPLYVCKSPHTVYTTHIILYTHMSRMLQGCSPLYIIYIRDVCLYIRERIRLARDADSVFIIIIIIIIFNTSRTCSRIIYYIIMRSAAVGIVLAISYCNENSYRRRRAACRSNDFWATTPAEPRSANCERWRDE